MQNTSNQAVRLILEGNILKAESSEGITRHFAFPAAALSLRGKRIEARTPSGESRQLADGSLTAEFTDENCHFKVTVTPGGPGWFFKQIELSSDTALPTPDYVEVDCQKQPSAALESCGYRCTSSNTVDLISDEESSGIVPGCGYPLLGSDMFTGLEHPAAFNTVMTDENGISHWHLRHFPVWEQGRIISYRAVIGLGSDPRKLFFDYLDTIRLPVLKAPLIAFCSFWSDPHTGGSEYIVSKENYISLIDGFNKLDLHPDIYTLDAGWQDRQSFLRAKASYGGEQALMEIGQKIRSSGSNLSLWVSPNGKVGMSMDFLRAAGIAVGGGNSCHYTGPDYAVLMDERLQKELISRARELASPAYGVRHFKVDWDNECATAPEFAEKYPTRNHVREASINVMAEINKKVREIDPAICTRNGRWPSPWHLKLTTHTSLPNGGDCEFSDFPALSQRDSATSHRDLLYWCLFVRDRSVFPLDVLDNHEFGHSLRIPFQESPGVWSNTCVWAVMRGTSYHQYTLMPESLEERQADILRRTISEMRKNASLIITARSRMFGDSPASGGIYGFFHPGEKDSCLIGLRNSSPLPQEYELPADAPFYDQTYPVCCRYRAGEKVIFAPHEVKVLHGKSAENRLFPEQPCQLLPLAGGRYQRFLPASSRPDVLKIHQIPEIRQTFFKQEESTTPLEFTCGLMTPWRLRDFKLLFKVSDPDCTAADIEIRTSRFSNCRVSSYTVPCAEIPYGIPGSGERKNPDTIPERTVRYFASDLPQGGEVFFSVTIKKEGISPAAVELWVSGYEAPARHPEDETLELPGEFFMPLPHPEGFPRSFRIL